MDERARKLERRLEWPLNIAALVTLPALILEDSSSHGTWHTVGYVMGVATWIVFAIALVAMLAVVPSRTRWLLDHPLDVAIVLLTPPFLFSALQPLRVLRVVRLLRLYRLVPAARRVFTTEGLRYISLVALLTLLVGAEAFSSAEHISFGNAVYWGITTMTTVGYGDITPHTTVGKITAALVMVVGIGLFAILTGAVAQRFLHTEVVELEQQETDVLAQIRDISAQLRRLERAVAEQGDSKPAG
jgi:voltage-gated potassium channel